MRLLGSYLLGKPDYGLNAPSVPYSDALPTYLRITDISDDGRFLPDPTVCVSHPNADSHYLSAGDVVLARTGASVGKSYLYDPTDGPLVFAGYLIRVRPDPSRLVPGFLAVYLQSSRYRDWVRQMSTRSGQPGINATEYAQLPIPTPPLDEQRAIAALLADVDTSLRKQEDLIDKKRGVQAAAAQQLLTGSVRLPGFEGNWPTARLGEVLRIRHGKSQRGIVKEDGRFPILATSGEIGRTDHSLHDGPSVLIGRKGTIDAPQFVESPFWTIDTLFYSNVGPTADAKFMFYGFQRISWKSFNEASGVPSLNAATIEAIEFERLTNSGSIAMPASSTVNSRKSNAGVAAGFGAVLLLQITAVNKHRLTYWWRSCRERQTGSDSPSRM